MAFSMAAEIERDLISQRTREALRVRKDQGIKLGRPMGPSRSKLDRHRQRIEELLANGSTQKFIAKTFRTTEANLQTRAAHSSSFRWGHIACSHPGFSYKRSANSVKRCPLAFGNFRAFLFRESKKPSLCDYHYCKWLFLFILKKFLYSRQRPDDKSPTKCSPSRTRGAAVLNQGEKDQMKKQLGLITTLSAATLFAQTGSKTPKEALTSPLSEADARPPIENPGQRVPGNPGPNLNFMNRANLSNVIFHGVVKEIRYGFAADDGGKFADSPITFVTFDVIEVLRGPGNLRTFTVRHTGGPYRKRGSFLIPTHINHFKVGNEELIGIKENGIVHEPVTFRVSVLEGITYHASGSQLSIGPDGNVSLGAKSSSSRFSSVRVGDMDFSANMIGNEPEVELPDASKVLKSSQSISDFKVNLKKFISPASPHEEINEDVFNHLILN